MNKTDIFQTMYYFYDKYYQQPNIIQRAEIYSSNVVDYSEDKEELRELFWRYLSNIYGDLCDPRITDDKDFDKVKDIFLKTIKDKYPRQFKRYALEVIHLHFICAELFRNREEHLIDQMILNSYISGEPFTSWLKNPSVSKFNREYINREWWNEESIYKNKLDENRKEISAILKTKSETKEKLDHFLEVLDSKRTTDLADTNLLLTLKTMTTSEEDLRDIQAILMLESLSKNEALEMIVDTACKLKIDISREEISNKLDKAMNEDFYQYKDWWE